MHDVLDPCDTVPDELDQLRTSGFEVPDELAARIAAAAAARDAATLRALLPELTESARRVSDWPYAEPSRLEEIEAAMPGTSAPIERIVIAEDSLLSKVEGAWRGRCIGCCLGKPLEGLTPHQVRHYLRSAGAWPLLDYVPLLDPLPEGIEELNPSWETATRGRVVEMPRDDDVDYTVLALHVLQTYGPSFTAEDIAGEWLDKLPFLQTFTAERATYRNLVGNIPVDRAALHENPYREWIGALIRADMFGYVNPGRPREAARMAFVDASLSHTGNGVYGEMWAAALVAGAFAADSAEDALRRSLDWVPRGSRLEATLRQIVRLHEGGDSWDEATAWVDASFADHSWVHTLNNAASIAVSLLWGGDDIALSLGLTVQAGLDTDSATATVGSVLGAVQGVDALPGHLVEPLGDRVRSAVRGYDGVRVSELVERTLAVVAR